MGLPDRWFDFTNSGTVIESTPFVAFKTPLSKNFDGCLPVQKRFGPSMLRELHPNLRLVIDLTATTRYYKSEDVETLGIDYVKILVPGRKLPPENLVTRFFQVADQFRATVENGSEKNIIGVHCTHGLNRTGYFVCRYLVERMGFTPADAIEKFERARGHTMERPNYIDAIKACGSRALPVTSHVTRYRERSPIFARKQNVKGSKMSHSMRSRQQDLNHRQRYSNWTFGRPAESTRRERTYAAAAAAAAAERNYRWPEHANRSWRNYERSPSNQDESFWRDSYSNSGPSLYQIPQENYDYSERYRSRVPKD